MLYKHYNFIIVNFAVVIIFYVINGSIVVFLVKNCFVLHYLLVLNIFQTILFIFTNRLHFHIYVNFALFYIVSILISFIFE